MRLTTLVAVLMLGGFVNVNDCGRLGEAEDRGNKRETGNPGGKTDDAAHALAELNAVFRDNYRKTRSQILSGAGPTVIVRGDYLTLLSGQRRVKGRMVSPLYHRLKAVAHTPLAVVVTLSTACAQALTEEKVKELQRLRNATAKANEIITAAGFDKKQLKRQQSILTDSFEFIDNVVRAGKCEKSALIEFARNQTSRIEANLADAARLRIDAYHSQMVDFQEGLEPRDWAKLRVVIMGSHMARDQSLAMQYFARLLAETDEGNRIIYAESLYDVEHALELLGTHILDREAATAFFDDPSRLHRDVLADATAEYLNELHFEKVKE